MTRPDDETLMAYADGALDPETHARVEAYLETDAEARRTVTMFEASRAMAKGAFDEALSAPLPAGLVDMIRSGGRTSAEPGTASGRPNVVPLRRKPETTRLVSRYALPLAASLALVAGVGLGFLMSKSPTDGGSATFKLAVGPLAPGDTLHDLLESKASYDPVKVTSAGQPNLIVAVATFPDRIDRACREFEITTADADRRVLGLGVACRSKSGQWSVEGIAQPVVADTKGQPIKPAAGAQESVALDGLMKMLGAKDALSPEAEKALLKRAWKLGE